MDQGVLPGTIPVLYECHFQQPQVTFEKTHTCGYRAGIKSLILTSFLFNQHCYYTTDNEIIIGGLKSHRYNNNRCLVDPGSGSLPTLQDCLMAKLNHLHMHWDFTQVSSLTEKRHQSNNSYPRMTSYNQKSSTYCSCCTFCSCQTLLGPSNQEQGNKQMSWDRSGGKLWLSTHHSAMQPAELDDPASHHKLLVQFSTLLLCSWSEMTIPVCLIIVIYWNPHRVALTNAMLELFINLSFL